MMSWAFCPGLRHQAVGRLEPEALHTHHVDLLVAVQQIDAAADADDGVAHAAEPLRAAAEPGGVVGMGLPSPRTSRPMAYYFRRGCGRSR